MEAGAWVVLVATKATYTKRKMLRLDLVWSSVLPLFACRRDSSESEPGTPGHGKSERVSLASQLVTIFNSVCGLSLSRDIDHMLSYYLTLLASKIQVP